MGVQFEYECIHHWQILYNFINSFLRPEWKLFSYSWIWFYSISVTLTGTKHAFGYILILMAATIKGNLFIFICFSFDQQIYLNKPFFVSKKKKKKKQKKCHFNHVIEPDVRVHLVVRIVVPAMPNIPEPGLVPKTNDSIHKYARIEDPTPASLTKLSQLA